jgi:hypothetical protein
MTGTSQYPVQGSTDEMLFQIFSEFFAGKGVHVGTLYSEDLTPPLVLARRERRSGAIGLQADERFESSAIITVNAITEGLDADEEAEELQEACRIALLQAFTEQRVYPNGGSISLLKVASPASRVSDWATSTGVVQYAALPTGWTRHESVWRLMIRPPKQSTITNRFLTPGP